MITARARRLMLWMVIAAGAAACGTPRAAAVAGEAGLAGEAGRWRQGLAADVDAWRRSWRSPGAAVVVVNRAGLAFSTASGTRDTGSGEAVTVDSTFPIASLSKTFTAAAIGLLVERGALGWDDPVVEHLPELALGDPAWAAQVTIRDLLSHRSGLPAHAVDGLLMPLVMSGQRCTREALYGYAATLKPAHGLRQREAYSNLGYVILADVIGHVAGSSWADFVRSELLEPLGMTHTVVGRAAFLSLGDAASPHDLDPEGVLAPIPLADFGECNDGAGLIFSSAADLGTWLRLFLNGGRHGDRQVLARETVAELLRPQMLASPGPVLSLHAGSDFAAWSLGWEVTQHKGATVIRMGGSGPGYQGALFMIPRSDVGVVVLQNVGGNGFYVSTALTVLDRIAGFEPTDWTAVFRAYFPLPPDREAAPIPAAKLDDYAGDYTCEGYPRRIERDGERLYVRGKLPIGMGPPMYGKARLFGLASDASEETLFVRTSDAVFTFSRDGSGAVVGFTERTADGDHEFVRADRSEP